jgi:hypothetical protein
MEVVVAARPAAAVLRKSLRSMMHLLKKATVHTRLGVRRMHG